MTNHMTKKLSACFLAVTLFAGTTPAVAAPARIKELVDILGVRENALYGYGLVVGLSGTGDTERVFFTSQSISGMLGRLGIRIDPKEVRVRNVAAVMVTASLPSFSRPGSKLNVHVGSMGNARSLSGGILLVTPLAGADGQVYALAQGPVQTGGFDYAASGSRVQKNQPTSGVIAGGATIERAVLPNLYSQPLVLNLKLPDFTTAQRIANAVNEHMKEEIAEPIDASAVSIKTPVMYQGKPMVGLLSEIESVEVEADHKARIVISERTGTVVAGERVQIRPVAIAHGGLSISVTETPIISQPGPFSRTGTTVKARVANVDVRESNNKVVALPATTTVDDLVKALNLLGASPRDLISILQVMKTQGAYDADLEVM